MPTTVIMKTSILILVFVIVAGCVVVASILYQRINRPFTTLNIELLEIGILKGAAGPDGLTRCKLEEFLELHKEWDDTYTRIFFTLSGARDPHMVQSYFDTMAINSLVTRGITIWEYVAMRKMVADFLVAEDSDKYANHSFVKMMESEGYSRLFVQSRLEPALASCDREDFIRVKERLMDSVERPLLRAAEYSFVRRYVIHLSKRQAQ